MGNEMRGKRYEIDTEKLLADTDIFYLSYVGKIGTEQLKAQLKENKLNYGAFHALENAGFDIRKYWVINGKNNTIQIKEDALYTLLQKSKYKKLAWKLDGFMNIRLFKSLYSYMEFCDRANLSYSTFLDDEDYKEYLEKIEASRLVQAEETIGKPEQNVSEKPKAYIKQPSSNLSKLEDIESRLDRIEKKLDNSIRMNELFRIGWSNYGDDLPSIVSILAHRYDTASSSSQKMFSKYKDELQNDVVNAILAHWLAETYEISVRIPSQAENILAPRNLYYIWKAPYEENIYRGEST